MATQMEQDAMTVIRFIVAKQEKARLQVQLLGDEPSCSAVGREIREGTGLEPGRINDAVALLEMNGYAETMKHMGGVNRVLRRLAGHGIVDVQEAGSALLYALNRDHLAAPAVMILDGLRAELGRRLSEAIEAWEVPPLHASMFGSAARGDGDTESDIDLLIVRRDEVEEDDARWRGQLDDLATSVRRWTGNHAGIAEVSGRETRRLKLEQPPVYEDLLAHAIDLFGVPVATILEGADR